VSSPRKESGLLMATELRQAAGVVRRQSQTLGRPLNKFAALLRNSPPRVVVTRSWQLSQCCDLWKYLIERHRYSRS
jgi:hypothetical protein